MPASSPLDLILARIAQDGPLPFEEFQSAALYGPGGFYSSGNLRSIKGGDFLTSPEVSPHFGTTLAAFVRAEQARLTTDSFTLVEVAGGSGSLLRPLLEQAACADVRVVEASPAAREALATIEGVGSVLSDVSGLPDAFEGVVIANELLDNLPVAIAVRRGSGWRELWVGADGQRLTLVDAAPRPEVVEWCERFGLPCPDGGLVEVQIEASDWVAGMVGRLTAGSLVLIDYGDVTENLEDRRSDGTLRTYRSHRLGEHPLDNPGSADITADVNFSAMIAAGEAAGADSRFSRQDEFLASLGLRGKLADLRRAALVAAKEGATMHQLQLKSEVREIETLFAPRGLGEFGVLVLTK